MRIAERLEARYEKASGLDWPWWVPFGVAAGAVVVVVVALAQRDALSSPGVDLLLGLVVVSPWLLEHALGWFLPRPLFALVVIAGTAALTSDAAQFDFAPFVLFLLAGEMAATASMTVGVATAVGSAGAIVALDATDRFSGSPLWVVGIAFGWALGLAIQRQLRLLEEERASRHALTARAAVEERQRIARDVHDVVAHSLSVTMLHLTAARHALEHDGDIDEAVDSLREAERLGREAMADIRRTVGLLDQGERGRRRPPGLDDVGPLVEEFRRAGVAVDARLADAPPEIDPATGLAVFRIVEEALANVAKHAPTAPTRLDVSVTVSGVQVVVQTVDATGRHDAAPADPGRGIRGMRERAELLGGTLDAGWVEEGWRVRANLPLDVREVAGG